MKQVRDIVNLALAKRAEAGIKVRQPLSKLTIKVKLDKSLLDLIKDEVNVKEIVVGKQLKLNTKITKELEEEGADREWVRIVNNMRKKKGLTPKDIIIIDTTKDMSNKKKVLVDVRAKEINVKNKVEGEKVEINKKKYYIKIK